MSNVSEKWECPTCHKLVQIMKLNPDKEREGWYIKRGKLLVDGLVSYFWFHCKPISYLSNFDFDYDIILNLSIFKGPNSLLEVKIIE
jgi:hypothetical protein